jgi:membrane protein required for colicin V production
MSPYDLAMIGVVIAGMVWGALRGITWQLASMASLVLGYAISFPLSGQLAPHFPGDPVIARALAMLTLYVAVSGGIFLVAWSIRAILRKWQFEAYDRHLGMVLGGLEGAMLGIVLTLFVISLAPGTRTPILDSTAGKVVGGILDAIQPALPGEMRSVLANHWNPEKTPTSARLAARLSDDIKASLKPTPSSDPNDAVAEIETEVKGLVNQGVAAISDQPLPEKSDPSLVKSVLKRENEKLGRRIQSRLGNPDDSDASPGLKGFLKKGGARIGEAVTETINEEIDNLGERSNGRRIERR